MFHSGANLALSLASLASELALTVLRHMSRARHRRACAAYLRLL